MVDKQSRYAKVGTNSIPDASGEVQETLELRAIPPTTGVFFHTPHEGERLDLLAHRYLRDPRKFWRICDASDELDPFDVVAPGQPVLIPPGR